METAFLSLQEVASILQIHEQTAYRLAQKGSIPSIKIGRKYKFHKEKFNNWMHDEILKGAF